MSAKVKIEIKSPFPNLIIRVPCDILGVKGNPHLESQKST
jgi:hypothetical protein